uniref:Endonuclease/exonuclease/phosphatase domain-containing protein n=1 Tax=Eutreptiella gymnastica TaxID=73025 RepID=A0A7S1N8S7_9EUGL|mmetsp:Transcript_137937/g.239834  ORF Transcript_137937/g.239834 Transcript_137937/m.239834 type:complete len:232 (+) Transcript_137937:159-854(+)
MGTGEPVEMAAEVLRDVNFMSLNINGLETDDLTRFRGIKRPRWIQLKASMSNNDIHVLGLQEHHYKSRAPTQESRIQAHERMEQGTKKLRGQKWSMMGNLSLTPKSGVLTMWQHSRWTLKNSYSTDSRVLVCHFDDEDGGEWTVVTAHFHHDPAPRKKQWARLVATLQMMEAKKVVVLADHNSVLHETLDSTSPMEETGEDTYYRTATRTARQKEQEAYGALDLLDVRPLV